MKRTPLSSLATWSLMLTAMALLASCQKKTDVAVAPAEDDQVIYAVNAYKTSTGNLDDYLEFGGDVASVSAVDIMPDAAGKISRILVSVGDKVNKDEVIAYVDPSRPGMNYRASPVKAPISGRITSFTPTIGAAVSQSMSIAKISKTDDLEIKMSVAERFISRIKNGQIANVTFDAYPGVTFAAKVVEVSPVLDTLTRTMSVKLHLTEKDSRIKVGMYARIKLVTDSIRDVIVIPSSCVVTRDGKSYVFVVSQKDAGNNATAVLRAITPGILVDNKMEVTDGLSAGEEIVSRGQTLLNDGAKIAILAVTGAEE